MAVKRGPEQIFVGIYMNVLEICEVKFCMKGRIEDTIDDFSEEITIP